MPVAAHPQAVPDVIEETKTTPSSAELMAARGAKLDSLAVHRLRTQGQTSPTGRSGE